MNIRFSTTELRDLGAAWVVLGLAFALFIFGPGALASSGGLLILGLSMLTAGVGFLLHELAHKVVAINYGQVAEFRADYSMLFVGLMAAFAGFLFAAPGAVYHRGYLNPREQGLIALAGPIANIVLLAVFVPLWLLGTGLVELAGLLGVYINLLLAAFNMIPFGPLDGKTVLGWSKVVWAAFFVPTVAAAVFILFPGLVSLVPGL